MGFYRVFLALCLSAVSMLSLAQPVSQADDHSAEAERAKALLGKAVAAYQAEGDKALAKFSRQGDYIDGELYIYVVDTSGVMLASGGPSATLIGKQVTNVLDEDLKDAFEAALKAPEDGTVRSADYRWWNWQHGKVERKQVFYQRVGDRIISVGYYMPRSSSEAAEKLLEKVASEVKADPKTTFDRINRHDKALSQDDLYAFVVDLNTQKFIAHGFIRRLVGTDFQALRSADGQPIGKQMLRAMAQGDTGEVSYIWRNPITGQTEYKKTLLKKVDGYAVAVGSYEKSMKLD